MITKEQIDAGISVRKAQTNKLIAELNENRQVLNKLCLEVLLNAEDMTLKGRAAEILRQQLPTNEAK